MGPGFAQLERTAPDAAKLARSLAELRDELQSQPSLTDAEAELERAIESLQSTLADTAEPQRKALFDALDADLVGDLPRDLGRLSAGLRAEPLERSDLPPELLERWIAADGRELIEITPEEDVAGNAAARRFVESVRAVVPSATGLPVVYQEASRTVVRSFQLALLYASIMVTFLLWIFLRSGADLLRVLLPILVAAGVTAGAAVWFGIPFNFANIIALPLLVGIGVDNGIHIVHRMRTAPPANGTPFGTSTSEAMLASTLTTIASFGNLAFSAHRGMASMGQLLTLGMIVTLAATLILLPAMLQRSSER
jgi:predicted RND superfamily exporter protein